MAVDSKSLAQAAPAAAEAKPAKAPKVVARGVNVHYGAKHALKEVSVDIPEKGVMAQVLNSKKTF